MNKCLFKSLKILIKLQSKEVILMRRLINKLSLWILFILIISFILPGCYTQLSRPRVATEDEYYEQTEEVDEYYQDDDDDTAT